MAVTLTLRDVPSDVARALRARAKRNGRSVQKELLSILRGATVDRAALEEHLAAARSLMKQPLTLPEIRDAIDEGRP